MTLLSIYEARRPTPRTMGAAARTQEMFDVSPGRALSTDRPTFETERELSAVCGDYGFLTKTRVVAKSVIIAEHAPVDQDGQLMDGYPRHEVLVSRRGRRTDSVCGRATTSWRAGSSGPGGRKTRSTQAAADGVPGLPPMAISSPREIIASNPSFFPSSLLLVFFFFFSFPCFSWSFFKSTCGRRA